MKTLSKDDFAKIADGLMDRVNKEYPEESSPMVNKVATIAIDMCNCFFQEYEKMKNE